MIETQWLLVGPTASGKTQWALDNLSNDRFEIIGVDSCQVYRELSVGSAKINAEEMRQLPHHVIDCVSVTEHYDVARYLNDAQNACEKILKKGLTALHLGGSMLYADKLMHGLNDVPYVPKNIWEQLEKIRCESGLEVLWQELIERDASYETRLHRNDRQRIIRALAVLNHTGQPLYSYWHQTQVPNVRLAMIMPESRGELHESIVRRVEHMLTGGIIEETERWFIDQAEIPYQGLRSVGYRQTWDYLRGHMTYDALKDSIVVATFKYVKQQITWMRRWKYKADVIVSQKDMSPLNAWILSN